MEKNDLIKYGIFIIVLVLIFFFFRYLPESTSSDDIERGFEIRALGQLELWMMVGWTLMYFGIIRVFKFSKENSKK